jgi:hypothetical protein
LASLLSARVETGNPDKEEVMVAGDMVTVKSRLAGMQRCGGKCGRKRMQSVMKTRCELV